jgi:hypothetical protein
VPIYVRATGVLDHVHICFSHSDSIGKPYLFPCGFYNLPENDGVQFPFSLPPGDYYIDIDTPKEKGRVWQRLTYAQSGKMGIALSIVHRKYNQEAICQIPREGDLPLCN